MVHHPVDRAGHAAVGIWILRHIREGDSAHSTPGARHRAGSGHRATVWQDGWRVGAGAGTGGDLVGS